MARALEAGQGFADRGGDGPGGGRREKASAVLFGLGGGHLQPDVHEFGRAMVEKQTEGESGRFRTAIYQPSPGWMGSRLCSRCIRRRVRNTCSF